jgi:hypothetical protein
MGVILRPAVQRSDDDGLFINWWTWRPLVALLRRQHVLDAPKAEALDLVRTPDAALTEAQTVAVADFLDALLQRHRPGERFLLDGSTTTEPDTGQLHLVRWDKNYSVGVDWLKDFAAFCRRSGGFTVS